MTNGDELVRMLEACKMELSASSSGARDVEGEPTRAIAVDAHDARGARAVQWSYPYTGIAAQSASDVALSPRPKR